MRLLIALLLSVLVLASVTAQSPLQQISCAPDYIVVYPVDDSTIEYECVPASEPEPTPTEEPTPEPTPVPSPEPTPAPSEPATCTRSISGTVDGGASPGDVLCLEAGNHGKVELRNLHGTAEQPITVINSGGKAVLQSLTVRESSHLRVLGNGVPDIQYGIVVDASGRNVAVRFIERATDFEVGYVELFGSTIGLGAHTEATCEYDQTNFKVTNVHIHHTFIHDVSGEGMYVGKNNTDQPTNVCGRQVLQPLVENVNIHDNIVQDFGKDGINVKGAPAGDNRVHHNTVLRGSSLQDPGQVGAIRLARNTSVDVTDNTVEGNLGPGISDGGNGGNTIARNAIRNVGSLFSGSEPKGSGIDIRPSNNYGPTDVLDNVIDGTATYGIYSQQSGSIQGNRISNTGNTPIYAPNADIGANP